MKIIHGCLAVVLLLVLGTAMGYPPQERLMPDGAPVPEEAVEHEDSVAAASEVGEEYEDEDDSDMYMEPDGAETMRQEDDRQGKIVTSTPRGEKPGENAGKRESEGEEEETGESSTEKNSSGDQEARNTEQSGVTEDPEEKSLETESQNFFPSFAELFANHRLPFAEQQQRFRPNRFLGYFQRDRSAYQSAATTAKDAQHPLLGSGNFGVIRGGTYYPEEKENDEYPREEGFPAPYFHGGSRSRGSYFRNPKPQPIRSGDFFANFRDFADITAPPKSSFSHLSVVYANKNGSAPGSRITEPRNIIETLQMLEEEEQQSTTIPTTTAEVPRKKESKGKRKLTKMRQREEDKARRSRMPVEPLLALS